MRTCILFPITTCECEIWVLRKLDMKRIIAFEIGKGHQGTHILLQYKINMHGRAYLTTRFAIAVSTRQNRLNSTFKIIPQLNCQIHANGVYTSWHCLFMNAELQQSVIYKSSIYRYIWFPIALSPSHLLLHFVECQCSNRQHLQMISLISL